MTKKLAVHWLRFGPYHIARMKAAHALLAAHDIEAIGLATGSKDVDYAWREITDTMPYRQFTAFPGAAHQHISTPQLWRRYFSLLGEIKPDVVAIAGYSTPSAMAILTWCMTNRTPAILMTATKADDSARSATREAVKRGFVSRYRAAVCGGRHQRAYLEELGMPATVIFDGYDVVDNDHFGCEARRIQQGEVQVDHLPGLKDGHPFFVSSARFYKRKNIDGLLRAYRDYRRRMEAEAPDVQIRRLILMGDGDEQANLEQMVKDESIADVVFAGFRQIDELPAYYSLSDALVHPAYVEPWGLVMNEAMASGTPVLVSNLCGCADDLVIDNETGFQFDPHDLGALTDLMFKLSVDDALRARLRKGALAHIQKWGPPRFADALLSATNIATK